MSDDAAGAKTTTHDPRVLRAIAHPVRSRILDELGASGPLRAADVARSIGVPANQASFHLRQLAKYGLVVEAPEAARDGRDRVWRAVAEDGLALTVSDLEEQPGGKAAAAVWRRHSEGWAHQVVAAAYDTEHRGGTTTTITSQSVRLTKEEATQLARELDDVLLAWRRRQRGRDDGVERATYLYFSMLQPHPADPSAAEDVADPQGPGVAEEESDA